MKLFQNLVIAFTGLILAGAAQADQLTYTLTGPQFTSTTGVFSLTDRITGFVSFDSSKLDAAGNGSIVTSDGALDAGIAWQFQDGYNLFNNTLTTAGFTIAMSFSNFAATGWNIDPTWGYTTGADIWLDSNQGSYESWYAGNVARGPAANLGDWQLSVAAVPEPATWAMLLGGLGLIAALARRRA